MTSSFPSQPFPNEYQSILGQTYFFQGSRLEADHPAIDDISNRVATTGWVKSELCGIELLPIVSKVDLLLISVSEGVVTQPGTMFTANVKSTVTPIGVNKNSIENVYIRYMDSSVVVTTSELTEMDGYLLAIVTTDDTEIISIEPTSSPLGWAKLDSPIFAGQPKVPTPPLSSNDKTIANTEWITSKLNTFKSEIETVLDDTLEELNTEITSFQTEMNDFREEVSDIKTDLNNSIEQKLDLIKEEIFLISSIFTKNENVSISELPKVTQIENLKIKVSAGKVGLPTGMVCSSSNCSNGICNVSETEIYISANIGNIDTPDKHVWVRYSDCSVVCSESPPASNIGFKLAEITSNSSTITNIKNVALDISALLGNFVSKYGGEIMPK